MATIAASKPSATTGNNRLAHLQGVASSQFQRHQKATAEATQAYLDCGAALIEAKAGCGHGEWLPWLAGAGIPKRTAQRMMALAESGMKSDTVTHLGGIRRALEFVGQKDGSGFLHGLDQCEFYFDLMAVAFGKLIELIDAIEDPRLEWATEFDCCAEQWKAATFQFSREMDGAGDFALRLLSTGGSDAVLKAMPRMKALMDDSLQRNRWWKKTSEEFAPIAEAAQARMASRGGADT